MTGQQKKLLVGLAVAAGAILLLVFSCWPMGRYTRRDHPKPLSDLQVAETWLQCIDCRGSFLKHMNDLSGERRDNVVRFLGHALLAGPDSAVGARVNRELRQTWAADSAYLADAGRAIEVHSPVFLARYRRGFEVRWRSRAATALGVLRDPAAMEALDSARSLPLSDQGDSAIALMVQRAIADSGRSLLDYYR
jgi:hypothetical protein